MAQPANLGLAALAAVRGPMALLLVAAALGGALVHATGEGLPAARSAMENALRSLHQAQDRYRRSGEEREIIARYLPAYERLEAEGFVGDEQRFNWLDALRIAGSQSGVFQLDYQVGAQQPYQTPAGVDPGHLQLRQSVMKLDMRLLHEGDISLFFRTLRALRVGIFTIDNCTLSRLGNNESPGTGTRAPLRYQPNVEAQCELRWITVRPASTGPETQP